MQEERGTIGEVRNNSYVVVILRTTAGGGARRGEEVGECVAGAPSSIHTSQLLLK